MNTPALHRPVTTHSAGGQAKASATRELSRRWPGVVALAAGLLLVASPAALASSPRTEHVEGDWVNSLPPVITAYDPGSGHFSGSGSSVWTGSWSGTTTWTTTGTLNLLTGDVEGTLDETFDGSSADGGRGTLHFTETYTVDGATSKIHIDATLLDGTGDFAGSRGRVTFDGLSLPSGQGGGTYTGSWTRGPSGNRTQSTGGRQPALRLRCRPRGVRAGQRVTYRFRVTALDGGQRRAIEGAVVRVGRRTVRTNRRGRATLLLRFSAPGRRWASASKTGYVPGRAKVRISPAG